MNSSFYRARIAVMEYLISITESDKNSINNDRVILRNGVFPSTFNENQLVNQRLKDGHWSNAALTFDELTRFNTWFNLHPEKVCGQEFITTSREFPISIKGTKQEIINTISKDKSQILNINKDFNFQLQLKLKTAKSKLKLLKY